jgi:predicted PurR-regulated permease PerM
VHMSHPLSHSVVTRWFFLLLGAVTVYLFWQILLPYVIVLATAGIAAIVLAPLEYQIRKRVHNPKLTGVLVLVLVLVGIITPLVIIGSLLVGQINDLVAATIGNPTWRSSFSLQDFSVFNQLPTVIRTQILSYDPEVLFASGLTWLQGNVGTLFSSGANAVFKTFIFFICLYYFLVERKQIYRAMLDLSPFKDAMDRNIVIRMVETVRGVVFGSLIVAIVQSIVAGIGLAIFGVPGAAVWAALIIITSQIPVVGNGLIMVPAVLYLVATGQDVQAVGLAIWAAVAVGLVDNLLRPVIVGQRTHMHTLLILLSVLGGLEYFGPIGFIMGPTVLAALMVVLELYKAGILEKDSTASRTLIS